MTKRRVLLIDDLVAALQQARERWGNIEVRSTWESITPDIQAMYRGRNTDGTDVLLLDCDALDPEMYRTEFEHPDDVGKPGIEL